MARVDDATTPPTNKRLEILSIDVIPRYEHKRMRIVTQMLHVMEFLFQFIGETGKRRNSGVPDSSVTTH